MGIKAKYFASGNSASQDIELDIDDRGMIFASPAVFMPIHINDFKISGRIANIPRRFLFPDGSIIESRDNDCIDQWLRHHANKSDLLHRLENRFSYAIGAVLLVVVFIITATIWGVPWISEKVAAYVPDSTVRSVSNETLSYLDSGVFKHTNLPIQKQQELQSEFKNFLPRDKENFKFKLIFRDGSYIGANAFALPDGTIIMTDQLVELADNNNQIISVLLHEIGHVVHRHGIRQIINHSSLAVLTLAVFGDITAISSLLVVLPNLLLESSYSRTLEWEADGYALDKMQQMGIPPSNFADFLEKLETYSMQQMLKTKKTSTSGQCSTDPDYVPEGMEKEKQEKPEKKTENLTWLNYISSHPPTEERIARFRQAAK